MNYKGIQVTLRNFIEVQETGDKKDNVDPTPWVTVTISKNPVLKTYCDAFRPLWIAICEDIAREPFHHEKKWGSPRLWSPTF